MLDSSILVEDEKYSENIHKSYVKWFMIHLYTRIKCGFSQFEVTRLHFPINRLFVFVSNLFFQTHTFAYNNYSASFYWIDWHSNRFFSRLYESYRFILNVFSQKENKTMQEEHINHITFGKWEEKRECGAYASENPSIIQAFEISFIAKSTCQSAKTTVKKQKMYLIEKNIKSK